MPRRRLPPKDFQWTPALGYAVGLIATDGNLSKDQRHITMRSAEPPLLETFKQCLGVKNEIGTAVKKNGDVSYRVQFSNVQFYDWLVNIGVSPAKSLTIGTINIPDKFFRDYFRGCIDGDGNIRTYRNAYNIYKGRRYTTQSLFIRLCSASYAHIAWLRSKTIKLIGIRGAILKVPPRSAEHNTIWILQFAKKESLKLIDYIYYDPNVPCLERKRIIAQTAIDIIKNQSRKPYHKIL